MPRFLWPEMMEMLLTASFSRVLFCWSHSKLDECFPLVGGLKRFFAQSSYVLLISPVCCRWAFFLARVLQCVSSVYYWWSKIPLRARDFNWWDDLCIIFVIVLFCSPRDFLQANSREERDSEFDLDALVLRRGSRCKRDFLDVNLLSGSRKGCQSETSLRRASSRVKNCEGCIPGLSARNARLLLLNSVSRAAWMPGVERARVVSALAVVIKRKRRGGGDSWWGRPVSRKEG